MLDIDERQENENTMYVEKRRERRFHTTVRVQSEKLPNYFATTSDLSVSGMQIVPLQPLNAGEEFTFRLELPGLQKPVRGVAQVIWCLRGRQSRAGLYISDFDEGHRARLAHYLEKELKSPAFGQPEPKQQERKARAKVTEAVTIEAVLKEVVETPEMLTVTLLEEDEPNQWLFPFPTKVQGLAENEKVTRLAVRQRSSGRFRFIFLASGARPLLEFESEMPCEAS